MSEETYNPDKLIAGDYPLVTGELTIVSGQNLARGALLGKITSSGKYTLCDSSASDGSQDPKGILAEAVDASAADVSHVPYYLAGEFNAAAVIFGGSDTAATHLEALRDLSIYLQETVPV